MVMAGNIRPSAFAMRRSSSESHVCNARLFKEGFASSASENQVKRMARILFTRVWNLPFVPVLGRFWIGWTIDIRMSVLDAGDVVFFILILAASCSWVIPAFRRQLFANDEGFTTWLKCVALFCSWLMASAFGNAEGRKSDKMSNCIFALRESRISVQ